MSSLQAALHLIIPRSDFSKTEQHKRSTELVLEEEKITLLKDDLLSDLKMMAENQAIEAETREVVKWLVGFTAGRPGFDLWGVPDSE